MDDWMDRLGAIAIVVGVVLGNLAFLAVAFWLFRTIVLG